MSGCSAKAASATVYEDQGSSSPLAQPLVREHRDGMVAHLTHVNKDEVERRFGHVIVARTRVPTLLGLHA